MIHRISSDLKSFKRLDFHPGLNVLLAQKSEGATDKQTRNSAGKTSLIELIHYLTGASADAKSVVRAKALEGYRFGMEFDLGNVRTRVVRSTGKAAKIEVTSPAEADTAREIPNTEWSDILGEKMFRLHFQDTGPKPPTFRSLFAYFVRRQQSDAFVVPDKQAGMQQAWDSQLALMYLMGFDWQIARDWQLVKERESTLKELKKAAGLGTFGSIIGKSSDLRTQLTLAQAHLDRLRSEVDVFQVLSEYRELEKEADQITADLQSLANENVFDEANVRDLQAALASESDPSEINLEALYKEANVVLPEMVRKRYEDVRSFHASVVRNRRDYLAGELQAVRARIDGRNQAKTGLNARRSQVMGILNSHGALDEFNRLQSEAGRLGAEVESLQKRYAAAEQLEGTKTELEVERSQLELRLRRDFTEQEERLRDAILAFENISGRLYENAGNMNIEVTRNGPVFRFAMQGDRGTGIQKMQIFCFDMMLMILCVKRGFGPGFLIHDSPLFDGVDGRQIINAMRVGAEAAEEFGFQYIVTLNEDDAFKEREPGFDLNEYVLPERLTDATETGGLFGMRFD